MHRKEFLEEFVIDAIISYLTSKSEMNSIVTYLMKYQDKLFSENIALSYLEKEKRQCETALNNIMTAVEQGIINNTTNKRMKELEHKIEEIERKLILEKSKVSVKASEKDIREFFIQAIKLEAKMMISYLVKEIRLYDDKIEIQFNSPILKSPDESQGFLLYTKIARMPYVTLRDPNPDLDVMKIEIYI